MAIAAAQSITPRSSDHTRPTMTTKDKGDELETRVTKVYQELGWKHEKPREDIGVDHIIEKDGKRYVIQDKNWSHPVGPGVVSRTFGLVKCYDADGAIVICPAGLTRKGRKVADKLGVQHLDENNLQKLERSTDVYRKAEEARIAEELAEQKKKTDERRAAAQRAHRIQEQGVRVQATLEAEELAELASLAPPPVDGPPFVTEEAQVDAGPESQGNDDQDRGNVLLGRRGLWWLLLPVVLFLAAIGGTIAILARPVDGPPFVAGIKAPAAVSEPINSPKPPGVPTPTSSTPMVSPGNRVYCVLTPYVHKAIGLGWILDMEPEKKEFCSLSTPAWVWKPKPAVVKGGIRVWHTQKVP